MIDNIESWRFWALLAPLVVATSAAMTAILIVLLRPLLVRYALARPNTRSSHREPTPQGGGIAVIAAMIVVVLFVSHIGSVAVAERERLWWVLAASAFVAVAGAIDDIRDIDVAPRLLFQILAVSVVIAALPADLGIIPFLPWWIERAMLFVAGLWFVNLVNFMDGIDWMTIAEIVPVASGLVVLGMAGTFPVHGLIVALALLGAMLGFAPFNKPVARLFLGDVGSLPIGILLGWLLAILAGRGHFAAALLLPLYYLADATITLARRLVRGERVWQAHRTHFYQRATDRGLTVREVVGRVFMVNIALAALAIASVLMDSMAASISLLVIGGILVAWLLASFTRGRM